MTEKPYPEFPLTPHPRGSWVKKINGKMYYFGRISNGWKPALEKYKREIDDLRAGRTPPPDADSLTIEELCNEYLAAGKARVQTGELQNDSWLDSQRSAKFMVEVLGRQRGLAADRQHAGRAPGVQRHRGGARRAAGSMAKSCRARPR